MKFPSVEIEKRDRDDSTSNIINELLDSEKARKKQKGLDPRSNAAAVQPARKGKTFAEIEEEEGGPIKESLVGMAQVQRAQNRTKRDVEVGDTELVNNTERYEKDTLEVEEEGGITFEPFNLKQEREEGVFDEEGNYVLRKQDGDQDDEEKDAWLNSEEAKVVSEDVKRRLEAERARAEQAARRGPLTDRQIAQRKADMAAVMQPAETVARALKRLGAAGAAASGTAAGGGPRALGKRERARLLAQQQQAANGTTASGTGASAPASSNSTTPDDVASARQLFTQLTELADELLAEGELEIYSSTKDDLLRSARMWLPQLTAPPVPAPGAVTAGLGSGAAATAAVDSDDDMFGTDDKDSGGGARGGVVPAAAAVVAADEDQDIFADDNGDGKQEGEQGHAGRGGAVGVSGAAAGGATGLEQPSTRPGDGRDGALAQGGGRLPAGGGGTDARGQAAASTSVSQSAAAALGSNDGAVDYNSWPIKELKRLLKERGVDPSGFVEKGELVSRVRQVLAEGGPGSANGAGGGGGGGGEFVAPPGYVFDPSSGYFYSEESGMFYDTNTGAYCQASTGKWYYLDAATGSFEEWKQG